MNKDITSNSLEYHENTKHSEISIMTSPHYLDWNNRPYPFKIYTDLDSISLPSDFPLPTMNAILAINKSTWTNCTLIFNLVPAAYNVLSIRNAI